MSFVCPHCNPDILQPTVLQPAAGLCPLPGCGGVICGTCGQCLGKDMYAHKAGAA